MLRELGRGGMGAVLLVHDEERGQDVALKRVQRVSPRALFGLKREFRAIERLLHPALIRLHELGEDDEGLYYTMEVVEGVDLHAYCRGGGGEPVRSGVRTRGTEGSRPANAPPRDARPAAPTPPTMGARSDDASDAAAATEPTMDAGPIGPPRRSASVGLTVDATDPRATAPTLDARSTAPTMDARSTGAELDEPPASTHGAVPAAPHRKRSSLDVERLTVVLPQLLEGLGFLHAHGVVHRDLKPDNILVRADGGVKILDFGVLAELGRPAGREVVGTPGYMPPEQVRGLPATPACDLYALGVILFELATGRLPFEGHAMRVLQATILETPPDVRELAPDLPEPVAGACRRLMSKMPEARPTLAELAEELLIPLGARAPELVSMPARAAAPDAPRSLLGRDADAAAARRALRQARGVLLEGPGGVGKTALAEAVVREAERDGALVLRGRARPSDRVPYSALDAALDGLAPHIDAATVQRHADAVRIAAHAFVALGTTKAASELEPLLSAPTRNAVFDAIAELLGAVGEERPVWLFLDDLQWADADCLSLLTHLLDVGVPSLRLLATLRDDVGEQSIRRRLAERDDLVLQRVRPLPKAQLRSLVEQRARELRGGAAAALDPALLDAAVEACEGRPFLAEVVARSLEEAGGDRPPLTALVERVRGSHERLLALLLAADTWTEARELAELGGEAPGAVLDAVRDLEAAGVLRSAGQRGPRRRIDFYHDAVRTELAAQLPADRLRAAHRAFAERLERRDDASLLRRVRHLLGADERAAAARLAPQAAAEARAQQAFGLSADMMALAVEAATDAARGERFELLDRWAADLERAARYREAADCYARLAGEREGPERAEAMLRESSALLAARRIGAGYQRMNEALSALGEKRIGALGVGDLWAGLRFLRGPGRRKRARPPAQEDPFINAERDVRIGMMLAYFDPLGGIRFLFRAADRFERRGKLERAAWCYYYLAALAAFSRGKAGPVPLSDRYEAAARDLLGDAPPRSDMLRALAVFLDGYRAVRADRPEAAARIDEALQILERGGRVGTFEHLLAMSIWVNAVLMRQRVPPSREALERFRRAARGAPDTAVITHVAYLESMVLTREGKPGAALETLDALEAEWPREPATVQLILTELYRSLPSTYRAGGAFAAWRRLERAVRADRRFRVHDSIYAGFLAAQLAMTEALALRAGDRDVSVRAIRRHARAAERAVPVFELGAQRAVAYAEDHLGRPERAIELLARAEAEARARDCPLDEAIAQYQRGRRLGGDEGASLRNGARDRLERIGAASMLLDEDPGEVG